jgi:mRNA interferase RelE/StbE
MTYRIELAASAERELRAFDGDIRRRVARAIDDLATDPRPAGARALRGGADLYRIRVGAWRVVYRIEDDRLVVFVVRIGHRRDVYRKR